jgi:hypothetical protein
MCFEAAIGFLNTSGGMSVASDALGGIGSIVSGQNQSSQYEKRAIQIGDNARSQIRQTSKALDRRRGATAAAYGKQGVTLKGTAGRYLQEQIMQDELELLNIQKGAMVNIENEITKADESRRTGILGGAQGSIRAYGKYKEVTENKDIGGLAE